jgi:hypothetical protein
MLFDTEGRPPPGSYARRGHRPSSHSKGAAAVTSKHQLLLSRQTRCVGMASRGAGLSTAPRCTPVARSRAPAARADRGSRRAFVLASGSCLLRQSVKGSRRLAWDGGNYLLVLWRSARLSRSGPPGAMMCGGRIGPPYACREAVPWKCDGCRCRAWPWHGDRSGIRGRGTSGRAITSARRGRLPSLRRTAGTARAYRADAANARNLSGAIDRAIAELGPPDVLVDNAAVMQSDRPTELSAEEWAAGSRST